jgi:hypothetical protein
MIRRIRKSLTRFPEWPGTRSGSRGFSNLSASAEPGGVRQASPLENHLAANRAVNKFELDGCAGS